MAGTSTQILICRNAVEAYRAVMAPDNAVSGTVKMNMKVDVDWLILEVCTCLIGTSMAPNVRRSE